VLLREHLVSVPRFCKCSQCLGHRPNGSQ
jgi:hypothetical protein